MADPKTEIEKRLDRLELAVGTAVHWLARSTDFSTRAADDVEKILRGEIRKPGKKMPKDVTTQS
jgi:hypothetical protein